MADGARIYVSVQQDTHNLESLLKQCPVRVQAATKDVALGIIADVRENWSGVSPSSPGSPPAVVSGRLDESGRARLVKGGLISQYRVVFETAYAKYLENGTRRMSERPFLKPAVERARLKAKEAYKVVFSK